MTMPLPNNNVSAVPIQGGTSLALQLDFTSATSYTFDGTIRGANGIQTVYIDNAFGSNTLQVVVLQTQQSIVCPAKSQGYFPIACPNGARFLFSSLGGAVSSVQLLTVSMSANVWAAQGVGQLVQDAALETAISNGKLSVTDAVLEALITGGKLAVFDTALEAVITGGKLAVSDSALEAVIASGSMSVRDALLEGIISNGAATVVDGNSASYSQALSIQPGIPYAPLRALGFVCTNAGNLTLTVPIGAAPVFPIYPSPTLQQLPFITTQFALSAGAAGSFWNLG